MIKLCKKGVIAFILCMLFICPLVFAASTATQYDTDTKLMLHMDGADLGTTFTDSSSGAKTGTAKGNAYTETSIKEFGTASGNFDGTGDYVTFSDSTDWDLGTGEFTIDFWYKSSDSAGIEGLFGQAVDGTNFWGMSCAFNDGECYIRYYNAGAADVSTTFTVTQDTNWHHWAVTKSGTSIRLFKDGGLLGTDPDKSSFGTLAANFDVGRCSHLSSEVLYGTTGQIDEFRFVKGTAVWTANFTPPTAAYTAVSVRSRVRTVQ